MSTSSNTSDYKRHLTSFSITDALYKGIAISANAIFFAVLFKNKVSVLDSIFLSTFFHFLMNFFLEIPTSLLSDLIGPFKVIKVAFSLKILSTISFALFTYYSQQPSLAVIFLIGESLFDSISNSFISGSYQSAYLKKLLLNGISAQSFFVDSLQYSLILRFIIPTGFILFLAIFPVYSLNISLSLIFVIIFLRLILTLKIFYDFKGIEFLQPAQKLSISNAAAMLSSSILILKKNPDTFIGISFYSYLASIVFYVLPNLQSFLSSSTRYFMLTSTSITFTFYILITIAGFYYSRAASAKLLFSRKTTKISLNFILLLLLLAFIPLNFQLLKLIVLFVSTFGLYFFSSVGAKEFLDKTVSESGTDGYATALSISEMISMLLFCIPATINFLIKSEFFIVYLVFYTLILNIIIGHYESKKISS